MKSEGLSRNYVRVLNAIEGKLPELTGMIKQQAWAYRIRDYYIENCRYSLTVIKGCTSAGYWTENKEKLIGDVKLPAVKLPSLKGSKCDTIKAYPIRESFANRFPDVSLLKTQKEAAFWVNNVEFLEEVLSTELVMDQEAVNPPLPTSDNVDNINLNHYPGLSPLQAKACAEAILMAV
jgi:hypothetical protein